MNEFSFLKTPAKMMLITLLLSLTITVLSEYIYHIGLYNSLNVNMNNVVSNAIIMSSFKTPSGNIPYIKFSKFDNGGISTADLDEGNVYISTEEYRREFIDDFSYNIEKALSSIFNQQITLLRVAETSSYAEWIYSSSDINDFIGRINITAQKRGDAEVIIRIDIRHRYRMPGMVRLNNNSEILDNQNNRIYIERTFKIKQQV